MGRGGDAVIRAIAVQVENSKIDHVAATRFVLDKFAPRAALEQFSVRAV
jgi:hypothetical protein